MFSLFLVFSSGFIQVHSKQQNWHVIKTKDGYFLEFGNEENLHKAVNGSTKIEDEQKDNGVAVKEKGEYNNKDKRPGHKDKDEQKYKSANSKEKDKLSFREEKNVQQDKSSLIKEKDKHKYNASVIVDKDTQTNKGSNFGGKYKQKDKESLAKKKDEHSEKDEEKGEKGDIDSEKDEQKDEYPLAEEIEEYKEYIEYVENSNEKEAEEKATLDPKKKMNVTIQHLPERSHTKKKDEPAAL